MAFLSGGHITLPLMTACNEDGYTHADAEFSVFATALLHGLGDDHCGPYLLFRLGNLCKYASFKFNYFLENGGAGLSFPFGFFWYPWCVYNAYVKLPFGAAIRLLQVILVSKRLDAVK